MYSLQKLCASSPLAWSAAIGASSMQELVEAMGLLRLRGSPFARANIPNRAQALPRRDIMSVLGRKVKGINWEAWCGAERMDSMSINGRILEIEKKDCILYKA